MNDFKEWLSDYLRYFILAFIIIFIIAVAVLGINIYSRMATDKWKPTSEATVETEQETQTKVAMTETAKETSKEVTTEKETETETQFESTTETETMTETVRETEPEPVYLTMKSTCYLRADSSMESDILGEYYGGTTVLLLEDLGGWYKVKVDGLIGYMGARFF